MHEVAQASRDAELGLAPLGHFIGEPDFGPLTRALLGAFEGGDFRLRARLGPDAPAGPPNRNPPAEIIRSLIECSSVR